MAAVAERTEAGVDTIDLRQATEEDYQFLYSLTKTTMREYVEPIWGWDEERQRAHFRERFDPARVQIILLEGHEIGALAVETRPEELFLSQLYILPEYQRRGIGTRLLHSVLDEAAARGLPVTLQVLRGNPAKRLYERLGFTVTKETETRYRMKAVPGQR